MNNPKTHPNSGNPTTGKASLTFLFLEKDYQKLSTHI